MGWVSGKVIDSVGRPVRGALVNVLQPREVPEAGVLPDKSARRAVTGPRGKFRVRQAKQPYLVQICVPDAQAVPDRVGKRPRAWSSCRPMSGLPE